MNSIKEISAHKVFPMTYLRKVVFSMSYRKMTKECYSALIEFIRATFGFDVTEELLNDLSNRPLYFGTDDHTVEWSISDKFLNILISQEAYHSYADTLRPLVEIACSFLTVIQQDAEEVTLHKVNLIPVTLSTYEELRENAAQIFTEAILNTWNGEVYQKSESALIYLSKEKGSIGDNIETITGFISKEGVAEGQPSRYILDITDRHSGMVSPDRLLELTTSMNDKLYDVFIGSVVEDIIMSMEEA